MKGRGRRKKYRKRPSNDTGLGASSSGAEIGRSEEVRFSEVVKDAESNLSDCFDFSHEKRVGGLSCSTDMRGTMMGAEKRRTKPGHLNYRQCVYFYLPPREKLTTQCLRYPDNYLPAPFPLAPADESPRLQADTARLLLQLVLHMAP
jgi:hypothetical protein